MLKFTPEIHFKKTEIGEIPNDWEIKVLEKIIIEIKKGIKPKKNQNQSKNLLPYLSAEYLRGETNETDYFPENSGVIVSEEEVIVLWDGSNAGEIFRGMPGILSSTMAKLTPNRDTNPLFLFYQLKIREDEFKDTTTGTGIPHVDKQNLLLKEIIYPPPPEQSRIATVLSWFDDLIENKKKQNEILEKTAMAIFKSWFIDFEPFKDGKFVYNEELGREIPKGWDVKPIGEIAKLIKGVSYNTPDISSEQRGELFITLNNFLRGGGFKCEYSYYIGEKAKNNHIVREGDLIIALTDMTPLAQVVGAPAIVILPYGYNKGIISLDCAKIQLNDNYLTFFAYLYLKYTQEENSTFAGGVNVLHLKTNLFLTNKFILFPSSPILQKFHSIVEPLFQKIILNQKQIMLLRKIRDTLLPLLVFGKLRVMEI